MIIMVFSFRYSLETANAEPHRIDLFDKHSTENPYLDEISLRYVP